MLNRGYASGRQINWTFIGLARAAGFEAFETYLVPRNRDVFSPSGQNTGQLTADIVWARAGGKEYWLDPAALYYPFGLLPWYETESKGVRVTKQGGEFVETPAAASSDATLVRHADLEMKEDGSASGKLEVDFTGQTGALRRTWNRREDETGRYKALEKEIQRWLPGGSTFEVTKVANWENTAEPLRVEGTATVPGLGSSAAHRMLVPDALFLTSFAKYFEPEQRVNPVYFSFRYEETDDVKIRVPEGYKIEAVPPERVIKPGTAVSYETTPAWQGDRVEVKRHFVLGEIHFGRDSYAALRAFFSSMRTNDEAQVVLQNANSAKND